MDQSLVIMIRVSPMPEHIDTILKAWRFPILASIYLVSLFLGTIDSTFMMTTEGFIMFNTDIRWDETLDRFVEFEKR